MEGGWFSTCGSHLSAAHIRRNRSPGFYELRAYLAFAPRAFVSKLTTDGQDAAVTLIRGVEIPGMVVWRDAGMSGHNSNIDSRLESKEWCRGTIAYSQALVFQRDSCSSESTFL
eukprot:7141105-Pyramimonas_sp.AAC.1